MKLQPTRRRRSQTAISLIDTVIAISALALIVTVGIGTFGGVTGSARTNKLKADVANLNNAIKVYEANGGHFAESNNPQAIIDRLKTRASASQRSRVVGLRDMMTDPRLVAVIQSAEEAQSDEPRALWDSQKHRFVIANEGAAGIKGFDLDEELAEQATAEEDRDLVLKYADNSTWVWNYTDQGIDPAAAPQNFASLNSQGHPGLPNGVNARQLDTPEFSVAGGTYPLADYALAVTLTNPNLPGASELMYSIAGGEWKVYEGGALVVSPSESIVAMGVTLDPDGWADSELEAATYKTTPVDLQLRVDVPKIAVNYAEVGGAMLPGGTPGTAPLAPATITLVNADEIPPMYTNSDVFAIHWTNDGSDPLSSPTRITGAPFSGGFPGRPVDYQLGVWGAGASTLSLKATTESLNGILVADSPVVEKTLSIDKVALRAPLVTGETPGGDLISMAADADYGDTPAGYQICYTVDGTDPGDDGNGKPLGGAKYTSITDLRRQICTSFEIRARVYGPPGYEHWFTPSPVTTLVRPPMRDTSDAYALVCDFIDSQLCQYTWLALEGGATLMETNYSLTGKVAAGPGAALQFNDVSGSIGDLYHDPSGSITGGPGGASADLTQHAADAVTLNQAALALTPTQSFGSITSSKTINATAADRMNVIAVDAITLSVGGLTLRGDADDYFIVNVAGDLWLSGSATFNLDGVDPDHVLFNVAPWVPADYDGLDPDEALGIKLTGQSLVLGASVLAPRTPVQIGGQGQIQGTLISGGQPRPIGPKVNGRYPEIRGSYVHGNARIDGGHALGGCDDCCD